VDYYSTEGMKAWDAYYDARRAQHEAHEAGCDKCIAYNNWIGVMSSLSKATGYYDVHSQNFTLDPETGMRYLFDYGGRVSEPVA
jgi:hypothetical protein